MKIQRRNLKAIVPSGAMSNVTSRNNSLTEALGSFIQYLPWRRRVSWANNPWELEWTTLEVFSKHVPISALLKIHPLNSAWLYIMWLYHPPQLMGSGLDTWTKLGQPRLFPRIPELESSLHNQDPLRKSFPASIDLKWVSVTFKQRELDHVRSPSKNPQGYSKNKNQISFQLVGMCLDSVTGQKVILTPGIFSRDLVLYYSKRTELTALQRQLPPRVFNISN